MRPLRRLDGYAAPASGNGRWPARKSVPLGCRCAFEPRLPPELLARRPDATAVLGRPGVDLVHRTARWALWSDGRVTRPEGLPDDCWRHQLDPGVEELLSLVWESERSGDFHRWSALARLARIERWETVALERPCFWAGKVDRLEAGEASGRRVELFLDYDAETGPDCAVQVWFERPGALLEALGPVGPRIVYEVQQPPEDYDRLARPAWVLLDLRRHTVELYRPRTTRDCGRHASRGFVREDVASLRMALARAGLAPGELELHESHVFEATDAQLLEAEIEHWGLAGASWRRDGEAWWIRHQGRDHGPCRTLHDLDAVARAAAR